MHRPVKHISSLLCQDSSLYFKKPLQDVRNFFESTKVDESAGFL